jgi:tetratricopeptide (TPR) repeat protein/O-antigen ligase
VYVLVFYLFVDLLRHGWPAELFVKALLVISVVVLGFGFRELALWYGQWHAIWGWTRPLPALTTRVHAFLGHPNWVAAFLNLLWPLALLRLSGTRARLPRLLLGAWLAAALVLLYFTSSRGGWLGTVAALGVIILLWRGSRQRLRSDARDVVCPLYPRLWAWLTARRWRIVVFGAIALGAGLALFTLLGRQLHHPSHGGVFEARYHFWKTAWIAFRSAPLWGVGPFTYGEIYLATHSVPPDGLYGVAHSFPINLVAESGLLGLAALAWVTLALVRGLWRAWRRYPPELRRVQVGALAALTGCAVHSQFDSVETVPALCVMLALVLSLCLSADAHRPTCQRARGWALPLGGAVVVVLLAGAAWSLWTYSPFSQGVLVANLDQWSAGTRLLDTAARRDPALAYYRLQAGYAHGVRAADGNPDELDAAIAHYQAGIARSPHYALNAANLGALYLQAGESELALEWMQRAVDQAPRAALFALNLGRLYEEKGSTAAQAELATRWYQAALDYAPEWARAAFWRATPLREAAASAWLEVHPPPAPVESPSSVDEWLVVGRSALLAGRNEEARLAFERAVGQDPNRIAAYLGQADVHLAMGRDRDAERSLRTALLAEGDARLDGVRARFALGRLYHERGNTGEAVALYEGALDAVRYPTVYGPGRQGASDYAWYLFYCESIWPDLLPQLTIITVTDEIAARMLELGGWYEELGDPAAALRIYRETLAAVPDLAEARERIQALEEP